MKAKVAVVALAFLLLILAGVIPSHSDSAPRVHIPSNFQNYSGELERLNITDPYGTFYSKTLKVVCLPGSKDELRGLFSIVERYPHGEVYFEGEDEFLVIFPAEGNVSGILPSFCSVVDESNLGEESRKILDETRKRLVLYRELESMVKTPEEKAFVSEELSDLEESINDPKLHPVNATGVWVRVEYAASSKEDVRPIVLVWTLLLLTALAGAVLYRRDRGLLVFFLVALVLSSIFLGFYVNGKIVHEERMATLEEVKGLAGHNWSYWKTCGEIQIEKEIRDMEDARDVEVLLEEFNLTPKLSRVDVFKGGECVQLYAVIPSNKVPKLKERAVQLGMTPFGVFNETELCAPWLDHAKTENRILLKYMDNLTPESRSLARRIVAENRREILNLTKGYGLSGVWITACATGPYPQGWLPRVSRTLAEWGLLLGILMVVIKLSGSKA